MLQATGHRPLILDEMVLRVNGNLAFCFYSGLYITPFMKFRENEEYTVLGDGIVFELFGVWYCFTSSSIILKYRLGFKPDVSTLC
jgi:hypothetical protein